MSDERVVQIPTPLDRLAKKLQSLLAQETVNREEWISIKKDICLAFVEARDRFRRDTEFSRWCDINGFGKSTINHQTRAAAIAMGREPEALRKCLEATDRKSLETIYRFEFPRFTNVRKPPKDAAKPQSTPKRDKASGAIRPLAEHGEPIPSVEQLTQELGVSEIVVRETKQFELGRIAGLREAREAPPIEPAEMPPTMKQRYEATLRATTRKLREEITATVTAEVHETYNLYLKRLKEREFWSERIIASHKGLISREVYRKIKACLHPDHNTFVFAAEALQIFSELESVLVKPEEPAVAGPLLPSTVAELLQRKAELARNRKKTSSKR